jgi:nitrogen fixation protein NifU and related proteins
MSDPIYRRALLRLAADAVGAGRLEVPHSSATVHNPACGDQMRVDVTVVDGRITALRHQVQACVLTQASAAILGAEAVGLDRAALSALRDHVAAMLEGGTVPEVPFEAYGAFEGVAEHKGRHVCVLLPLEAALKALNILETAKPGAERSQS